MGLLRKLFGLPPKEPKPSSPPTKTKTTFITPDPFTSDTQFASVKSHIRNLAQQDPTRFEALMRMAAFQTPHSWLEANFPPDQYHIIAPGPFPCDVPLSGPGLEGLQGDDTRMYIVRRVGGEGKKGMVLMKLVVYMGVPMGEDGEAKVWIGTEAMKSAEEGLLGLMRRMYEVGQLPGGCLAVVGMGMDMTVYQFEYEGGFFDPPEGFKFEQRRVDMGGLP